MTAIVTCGHTRSALAAVRALGRHRIPIAVGAMRRPALAQWSALATSTFLTADPQLRPEAFAYELGREVQGRGATSVLFPPMLLFTHCRSGGYTSPAVLRDSYHHNKRSAVLWNVMRLCNALITWELLRCRPEKSKRICVLKKWCRWLKRWVFH